MAEITDERAVEFLIKADLPVTTENVSMVQALLADALSEGPPVRKHLVARVKAEIAAGTYETPDKLKKAVDGLMEELGL